MKDEVFKAFKISEHVYWVGAIDWSIRDFHGYLTSRGTTYNAFLIVADKITLIDTVKTNFRDEMMSRISSVIDPADISIIISNHSEMDHSGSLPETIKAVCPDNVYASPMGVKALKGHFGDDFEVSPIKNGDSISLGNMDIVAMETRMLHWPDSMFSYLPEDRVLFSQDGFGMHLASYERFADEIEDAVLRNEGEKYFANILMPYAALIPKTFEKVGKAGIKPAIIAPDHGPIFRTPADIEKVIGYYTEWAAQKQHKKAVVVYDTMWGSTDVMARSICEGLENEGVRVKLMSLKNTHRSDVATEVLEAGAFIVGSPTINNNLFPAMADVMSYIKGLKPRNLIGAAFGSYGWSGEAVKQLEEILTEMKVDIASEGINTQYVPDDDALAKCYALGKEVGSKLNGKNTQ